METKKEKAQVVMESEEATLYQKDPKNFLRDYLMVFFAFHFLNTLSESRI